MLFYFSATGNTEHLAKIIAEKTDDKLICIEDAIRDSKFDYQLEDDERLGFAFPVYYGDMPDIFIQFAEKIHIKSGDHYYGYIAVTDGGMSEAAPDHLIHLLLKQGITINGVFGLRTVDTYYFYTKQYA